MKKLILKSALYFFLILIALEIIVRVFHLSKDTPTRIIDDYKVEKWKPNQQGFSVTGNRRQNFSEYHINNTGFNSYREFTPSNNKIEIALVGDSFIEGFHQDYYNSIGKKIEKSIPGIEVYEYGYAGYDFADQLHLIYAYKDHFDLIDHVVLGIKFSNDLTRDEYNVIMERLALESPVNRLLRKSKLLVYCKSIGILDPPKKLISRAKNIIKPSIPKKLISKQEVYQIKKERDKKYLKNFQSLVAKYGFEKHKFTLLLDSETTSENFLAYLKNEGFNYIDYSTYFKKSKKQKTLIYDRHWNDNGRSLIAKAITNYLIERKIIP